MIALAHKLDHELVPVRFALEGAHFRHPIDKIHMFIGPFDEKTESMMTGIIESKDTDVERKMLVDEIFRVLGNFMYENGTDLLWYGEIIDGHPKEDSLNLKIYLKTEHPMNPQAVDTITQLLRTSEHKMEFGIGKIELDAD